MLKESADVIESVPQRTEERKALELECRRVQKAVAALREKLPALLKEQRKSRIRAGALAVITSPLLFAALAVIYGWLVALIVTAGWAFAIIKIVLSIAGNTNVAAFEAELRSVENLLSASKARLVSAETVKRP